MLLPFLVCMWSTPLAKLHSPRQCFASVVAGRAVDTLQQWERRILSRRPRTLERRIAKALANCYTSCVSRLDCSENHLPLELAGDVFALFSRCSLTNRTESVLHRKAVTVCTLIHPDCNAYPTPICAMSSANCTKIERPWRCVEAKSDPSSRCS